MPGFYDQDGLRFAYPENWTIDEEEEYSAAASATVTSPQTAFWSVMVYDGLQDVQELAVCAVDALKSEYPQMEVEEANAPGTEAGCGYELSFSCFDLLSTATIYSFHHAGRTYLVLSQAEDHERESVEPLFQAMTTSLLQEC
ncbi:MAG: hypothetical protein ACR2NU_12540 [Aeoliella sp.]